MQFELTAIAGGMDICDAPADGYSGGGGWGGEAFDLSQRGGGSTDSAPGWACAALGTGAGMAAGMVTSGSMSIAAGYFAIAVPGVAVIGTVVAGVAGGYAAYYCNDSSGRP